MDIGVEGEVEFSLLRRLRGVSASYLEIPPRVFECRLACLQPSELHSARYGWESTMKRFKAKTNNIPVIAKVRPYIIVYVLLLFQLEFNFFLDLLS